MAAETPLDVLSHAVSLVETEDYCRMDDFRDSPSKELPTKELKYKRLKDRKELSNTMPLRIWNRKCSSPQQILSPEPDARNGQFFETSPGLLSCKNGENSPTVISPPYCNQLHKSDNTPPPCGHSFFSRRLTERQNQTGNCISLVHCDSDEDNNQPLDMSKKCSRQDEPQNTSMQQQQRPSVITCASALLKSQCSTKTDCQNSNCNGSSDEKRNDKDESDSNDDIRPGHRREILSGMCDPVIDEHFRRSLGKDYPEFLSSNPTSVGITVDDHFAKALGDTWLRLQQTKTSSIENVNKSTKKAAHSPSSSPLRSHPQDVVSL